MERLESRLKALYKHIPRPYKIFINPLLSFKSNDCKSPVVVAYLNKTNELYDGGNLNHMWNERLVIFLTLFLQLFKKCNSSMFIRILKLLIRGSTKSYSKHYNGQFETGESAYFCPLCKLNQADTLHMFHNILLHDSKDHPQKCEYEECTRSITDNFFIYCEECNKGYRTILSKKDVQINIKMYTFWRLAQKYSLFSNITPYHVDLFNQDYLRFQNSPLAVMHTIAEEYFTLLFEWSNREGSQHEMTINRGGEINTSTTTVADAQNVNVDLVNTTVGNEANDSDNTIAMTDTTLIDHTTSHPMDTETSISCPTGKEVKDSDDTITLIATALSDHTTHPMDTETRQIINSLYTQLNIDTNIPEPYSECVKILPIGESAALSPRPETPSHTDELSLNKFLKFAQPTQTTQPTQTPSNRLETEDTVKSVENLNLNTVIDELISSEDNNATTTVTSNGNNTETSTLKDVYSSVILMDLIEEANFYIYPTEVNHEQAQETTKTCTNTVNVDEPVSTEHYHIVLPQSDNTETSNIANEQVSLSEEPTTNTLPIVEHTRNNEPTQKSSLDNTVPDETDAGLVKHISSISMSECELNEMVNTLTRQISMDTSASSPYSNISEWAPNDECEQMTALNLSNKESSSPSSDHRYHPYRRRLSSRQSSDSSTGHCFTQNQSSEGYSIPYRSTVIQQSSPPYSNSSVINGSNTSSSTQSHRRIIHFEPQGMLHIKISDIDVYTSDPLRVSFT